MSMNKSFALTIVLIFLVTSCITMATPVSADTVTENSWVSKAPMHVARSALGVVALNGKIYAIGGSTSTRYPLDAFVGTNEEYNLATNSWTIKASMPTPRAYFAIAAYQNKIYCIGGATGMRLVDQRSGFYGYIMSNVTEVYDTVTNTWTTKTPMPVQGMQISAQQINGKIYVIGNSHVQVYDPVNDSWTDRGYMPMPRYSVVFNDKIIATGVHDIGYSPTSPYYGGTHPAQQIAIYDPEKNNLTQAKDGQIGVDGAAVGATVGIKAPQRVYVLGVTSQKVPDVPVNVVYDPRTDTWTTATAMPTIRTDFGVTVVNDTVYAIGGLLVSYSYDSTGKYIQSSQTTPTNISEQYIPLGYGTLHPEIRIFSPQSESYNSSSISLDFYTDKPILELSYSLDGKQNVTITGNFTITNLSNGLHNVTIYAKDTFGNMGASETTFTIARPESFPIVPVAATSAGASIAIAAIGLIYYYKKRKG